MSNAPAGQAARGKIISLISLCVLVLSLIFAITQKANKDTAETAGAGAVPLPTPDWAEKGKWETVSSFTSPIVASHVSVLPNGKVLAWGGNLVYPSPLPTPLGTPNRTKVQIWDPTAPCPTPPATPNPNDPPCIRETILPAEYENIYCSGHSFLSDGKLLISGGTPIGAQSQTPYQWGTNKTALYDYSVGLEGTWTQLSPMNARRWYPTNITMPNGNILVWGGFNEESIPNYQPQMLVQQPDGTYAWRTLNNLEVPETSFRYYSWLNMLSSGKILHTVGVSKTSYLLQIGQNYKYAKDLHYAFPFNPDPQQADGQLGYYHDGGTTVVYDKDKILAIGGRNEFSTGPTAVERLNVNNPNPQWEQVASMGNLRTWPNATILPDGKVLVTGGNKGVGFNNSCPENSVKEAEMWTPPTPVQSPSPEGPGTWTPLASANERRIYHSSAVLLPDGRVFTGGTSALAANPTGVCPNGPTDVYTIEVFYPPYFFNPDGSWATRPMINSGAENVSYGATQQYNVSDAGTNPTVSLVRLPSVTHAFNQSQGFVKIPLSGSGPVYNVTFPSYRNELVPGWYMMFFLTNAQKPVPSKAKMIRIS